VLKDVVVDAFEPDRKRLDQLVRQALEKQFAVRGRYARATRG
jgi:hypothetical protein